MCNTKSKAAFGIDLVFEVVNQEFIKGLLIAKLSDVACRQSLSSIYVFSVLGVVRSI